MVLWPVVWALWFAFCLWGFIEGFHQFLTFFRGLVEDFKRLYTEFCLWRGAKSDDSYKDGGLRRQKRRQARGWRPQNRGREGVVGGYLMPLQYTPRNGTEEHEILRKSQDGSYHVETP